MAQRGFKAVAPDVIRSHPGLTAFEVARIALQERLCGSDASAVTPEYSLGTTLLKEYREGRMPGIVAKRVNGKLLFYIAGFDFRSTDHDDALRVDVTLKGDVATYVRLLADVKEDLTPSEALVWLSEQGLAARRDDLDKLARVSSQINDLRRVADDLL